MRSTKHYKIDGHKKYKAIDLVPIPNSSQWKIMFDGRHAYNQNEFSLVEALEHVETWRKQYVVTEVGGETAQHIITTPMPSPKDVAKVLGIGKARAKSIAKLAAKLKGAK